jgi:hypothetical protein
MQNEKRKQLINAIQEKRDSVLICYLTSMRPGVQSQMAEDQVRVMFDHLLRFRQRPIDKLDVFLCSNGGSGTVPWRMVSLFREFSKSFNVLIPYRAYSAATMLALGADEIIMHPFGELGPIDPTVGNDFNPVEQGTGRKLGISVEDVKAYVSFIKDTVGITHEDELVQAIAILANNVHPLALGNVERFLSQSRMIAKKIMRSRRNPFDDHTIGEIVENMASRLYFHGHPINRREAREELGLSNVKDPDTDLEKMIWDLYQVYEGEFRNNEVWNPAVELEAIPKPQNGEKEMEATLLHAAIESESLASRYETKRRYREVAIPGAPPGQMGVVEQVVSQAWTHEAEEAADQQQESSS